MGEQRVERATAEELRRFMQHLLRDVRALDWMLEHGVLESGVHRIGAEQEVVLVGSSYRPAPVNLEVLADLDEPHFTTEVGRFNIELNLDPLELGGDCLSRLELQLQNLLAQARRSAAKYGAEIVLTGILPTFEISDLTLENMTPLPRYFALNEAMTRLRGGPYQFRIQGQDELLLRHDNVMLESCCTSFQVHLQVGPEEFARAYNVAQAIAAPVLAVSANSPLLFGRRLWRETRIALFQQSVDTRGESLDHRKLLPRVSFGHDWIDQSVLEIFREDITRFRLLLTADVEEDSLEALNANRIPLLRALRLHNGTVYRWNRPCYGVSPDGTAHLRIENRVLPAGPSVPDEIANAAFWLGLMRGLPEVIRDISRVMAFGTAEENLIAAARLGIHSQLSWPGLGDTPVQTLVLEHLLPIAHAGLEASGVERKDREHYLGLLEERVRRQRTGSRWQLESLQALGTTGTRAERMAALTAATIAHQKEGTPVTDWDLAQIEEAGGWARHYSRVGQYMTTGLFTVGEDELVDLVAAMMDWKHIRHVPVEDSAHRLIGLVTHRTLLRVLARGEFRQRPLPVREIMETELVTVSPESSTREAIRLMREHKIACLPVVEGERLVGIITERDFMNIARKLLEDALGEDAPREE